jgi:hypothetical protein
MQNTLAHCDIINKILIPNTILLKLIEKRFLLEHRVRTLDYFFQFLIKTPSVAYYTNRFIISVKTVGIPQNFTVFP